MSCTNLTGRTLENTYAVAQARPGEPARQTRARLLQWLAHLDLPAGERFAAQDVYEPLPDGSRLVRSARSYLLQGPPVITSADITRAEAGASGPPLPGCEVRVSLTDGGSRRFLDATRRLVHRRMALIFRGAVMTAPVVMSPIPGGHLTIMVEDNVAGGCPKAHKIAATLRGGAHGRGSR